MIGYLKIHVHTCIECKTVMFVHTNQISLCENFDNSFWGEGFRTAGYLPSANECMLSHRGHGAIRGFAFGLRPLAFAVLFRTEGTESSEDFNSISENSLLTCANSRPSISHSAFGFRPLAFELFAQRPRRAQRC